MCSWLKDFLKKSTKRFYFIHIPKTAGTSFINVFDSLAKESEIFPYQLWQEVNEEIVAKQKEFKLLRGHFGGGCHQQLLDKKSELLTILRHPQSLSISTYHHIKREKNSRVHDLVTSNKMTLLDFLEHPETHSKISNRMTRHLSFDLETDPEANELFLSEQSIKVIEKWKAKDVSITDSERLARAKKRLDQCCWFGIQDQFNESIQLFAYAFNLPPVLPVPFSNAYQPDQKISSKEQELIRKKNGLDLELYEYGLEQFKQKYQKMLNSLEYHRSSSQQSINDLIHENYLKNQRFKLVDQVEFDFSHALLGSGWHRREVTMPEQSTFRWTHNQQAYLDFWLKNHSYDLSIRIINAVSEKSLNELKLIINDQAINYEYDNNSGVVRILRTKIPANILQKGLLRIEFCINELKQHSEVFSSNDNRKVGIAVNWIKIIKDEQA